MGGDAFLSRAGSVCCNQMYILAVTVSFEFKVYIYEGRFSTSYL